MPEHTPTAEDVVPGSLWRSDMSGRTLVVFAVDGNRAEWGYVDDPDDRCWDGRAEIAHLFAFIAAASPTLGPQ